MKNTLTYSLPFSYKGELFRPTCTLDLDAQAKLGGLPCLFRRIANVNKIDVYSHEYDVMMMGTIEYIEAEGIAKQFMTKDSFDFEGFRKALA